jgi:hypothetical protein
MFSTNSSVETHEMRWMRLGRLALHKGEGPVPTRRLEHFEVVFFGPKTPHLNPLPSARGEATKRPRVGICGASFHEK